MANAIQIGREREGVKGCRQQQGCDPSQIMSTLVATYARRDNCYAGIATLWLVCTGNGSWQRGVWRRQYRCQGVASLFVCVCVCVCVSLSKRKLFACLFADRPKVAQRFVSFSLRFSSAFSHFLLLLSWLLFNSCYFHSLFSVVVYFVIRYYCVFLHSP